MNSAAEQRPCACTVCPERLGPGDAVSFDGFCHFCARQCHRLATTDGQRMRLELPRAERERLHGLLRAYGTVEPDAVRRLMVGRGVEGVAAAAAPHIETAVRKLQRRFLGPGRRSR